MNTQEKHQFVTISELSQLTGVNSVTLRAWERRYGLLKPQRSSKGHRLYLRDDIDKVISILAWINKGVSVGKVKPLLINGADENTVEISDQWNEYQSTLLSAAHDFNEGKIETIYQKITKQYPMSTCIQYCFKPLFELQYNNPDVSSGEYFLSSCLKYRLQNSLLFFNKSFKKADCKCVLLSHESSSSWKVWITALLLQEQGIKVHILDEVATIDSCLKIVVDLKPQYAVIYSESHADSITNDDIVFLNDHENIYLAGHKIWLAKNQQRFAPINGFILLNPIDILSQSIVKQKKN